MPRAQIKDEKTYQKLRDKGESKGKAARIANASAGSSRGKVGSKGGKSSAYDDWSKQDLLKRAKEIGIRGRSSMSKADLVKALRDHWPADPVPAPLTVSDALTSWQLAPLVSAVLIVLAAAYLGGVVLVGRRHRARPWQAGRTLAFLAGLAVIAVATQSSIGVYNDVLFSAHMVQHLLLIMVAPPLLVYARPVTLLLHASRNPVHTRVKRALRSRPVSALTWPPVAVMLYAAVVVSTHLTPLMNLVLENGAVHDAEHAVYLLAGYLFFLPVVGSEPVRWRVSVLGRYLLLLLVMMPVDTAVGVVLMLAPRELFRAYARAGRTWGPSLLADLHAGGLIMLAGSDLIMTVLAVGLAVSFVGGSGSRAARRPRMAGWTGVPADLDGYNAYLDSLRG